MKCGIVFSKYNRLGSAGSKQFRQPEPASLPDSADRWTGIAGKSALIGLMAFFFFYMVIKRSSWSFLDYVNLPFHESGHIFFRPFGETMQFIGGTIGQLMWPFILIFYFLRRKERLSAAFSLFWFGENFLNISKYVSDARSMSLPLVGGGIHDWNFLLSQWNVLKYDHEIAGVIFSAGVVVMAASIAWSLFITPKRHTVYPP